MEAKLLILTQRLSQKNVLCVLFLPRKKKSEIVFDTMSYSLEFFSHFQMCKDFQTVVHKSHLLKHYGIIGKEIKAMWEMHMRRRKEL